MLRGGAAPQRAAVPLSPVVGPVGFAGPCTGLLCLLPPAAMCEMIKIMQEYGEVTCCLGSSANLRNSCLFLQSDVRSGGHTGTGGQTLLLRP